MPRHILKLTNLLFLCIFFSFLSCINDDWVEDTSHERNAWIDWDNTVDSFGSDRPSSIIQSADGGYMVLSTSSGANGDKSEASIGDSADLWVIKLDQNGNFVWDHTIGGTHNDISWGNIIQTSDGGYLIGGESFSSISGDKSENSRGNSDCWIVKLDSSGEVVWDKTYGGNERDGVAHLLETPDGGYLIVAYSESGISGDRLDPLKGTNDIWVIKTDNNGNLEWQKTIGSLSIDRPTSALYTSDGGYLIGAHSVSDANGDKTEESNGLSDYWIIKLDLNGNIIWDRSIGGSRTETLTVIKETPDNGYVLGGHSDSNTSGDKSDDGQGNMDFWVVKINQSGDVQWDRTMGDVGEDLLFGMDITPAGNILIGGSTYITVPLDETNNTYGRDFRLFSLNSTGDIINETTIKGYASDRLAELATTSDGGAIACLSSNSGEGLDKSDTGINQDEDIWVIKIKPSIYFP